MGMRTQRIVRGRPLRVLFLGLATVAAALGFPVRVDPPPKRRTPIEVVRDEDDPAGIRSGGVR
jgi:hypothetical protein